MAIARTSGLLRNSGKVVQPLYTPRKLIIRRAGVGVKAGIESIRSVDILAMRLTSRKGNAQERYGCIEDARRIN